MGETILLELQSTKTERLEKTTFIAKKKGGEREKVLRAAPEGMGSRELPTLERNAPPMGSSHYLSKRKKTRLRQPRMNGQALLLQRHLR